MSTSLRIGLRRVSLFAACSVFAFCVSASARAGLAFTLAPIDPPVAEAPMFAVDLNNKGEVVGVFETSGTHAFLWKDGEFIDLTPLLPSGSTEAVGINDKSAIVGNSSSFPFLLRDGQRTDIVVPGVIAGVNAVNNRNQVVGTAGGDVYVWENGHVTFLEGLPESDLGSIPARINDRGVVAGTSGAALNRRPVIWKDGTIMDLGVPSGSTQAEAFDLNIWEHVLVRATVNGFVHSYVWRRGAYAELRQLDTAVTDNIAYSLNDWGLAVGTSIRTVGGVATAWFGNQAFDLNELIADDDPLKGQYTLNQAFSVNNRGQIVVIASTTTPPFSRTFLMTPVLR
jgi:probable HAF family extracellular repeat protein